MTIDRRRLMAAGLAIGVAGAAGPARALAPRRLVLAPGEAALLPAPARPTALALIDGQFPGPELRLRQGEPVAWRIENALDGPAALRLHGMRLPGERDGLHGLFPEPLAPGAQADVTFTPVDAGTYLLRPPATYGDLLERGLSAAVIVEEREPQGFDRDVVLVLKDIRLDAEGRVQPYPADGDLRRLGNMLTVNGLAARLELAARPHERLRVRLLNASNARILPVRIEGGRPVVLALDGQPSEPFEPAEAMVVLAPGNRADIALDAPGTAGAEVPLIAFVEGRPIPLARIVVSGPPLREAALPRPRPLPANPLVTRLDLARARRLQITVAAGERGQRTIAGRGRDPGAPLAQLRRGTTVVLQLDNQAPETHAIHMHGHALRPLDRLDDGWKPWLLDTVLLGDGETLQVAFVAERPGRFLISLVTAASGPRALIEVV